MPNTELHFFGKYLTRLVHTIRQNNGSWFPLGDVNIATGFAKFVTHIDCASSKSDLHVCATDSYGIWHAIRWGNGNWTPFGDVLAAASNPGYTETVKCVSLNGELHLITKNANHISHTIRHANGFWDNFSIIFQSTGQDLIGPVDITVVNQECHIFFSYGNQQTKINHIYRDVNGNWSNPDNISLFTGNPGFPLFLGCEGINGEIHLVLSTYSDPGFYHALRDVHNNWTNFGDIEKAAGDIGRVSDFSLGEVDGNLHYRRIRNL